MTRRRQPTELPDRNAAASPAAEELKPIKALCQEIAQEQNPAPFKELVYKLGALLDARERLSVSALSAAPRSNRS